ncbi:hypothetical protein CHEID_09230 [Corynebacterium heidelbergense]|nr:hypothetical protein [Corynebacterium heidelbergense]WCZ37372.1 hypothetical protein CHEID_09230 [Corynebacterium heidelbergense]
MSNLISSLVRKISSTMPTLGTTHRAPAPGTSATNKDAGLTPTQITAYLDSQQDLATPGLNALDRRSPSYLDIISYLVDMGRTPARSLDIQEAFVAIHDRLPGPGELGLITRRVSDFGLLA